MNIMALLGNKHGIHIEEGKSRSTMSFIYLKFEANLLSKECFCDVLVMLCIKAAAQPHLSPNQRRIGGDCKSTGSYWTRLSKIS